MLLPGWPRIGYVHAKAATPFHVAGVALLNAWWLCPTTTLAERSSGVLSVRGR